LASNSQIAAGVANSSDAVGRYFMEHPHYNFSVGWVMNDPIDLDFYLMHEVTAEVDGLALNDTMIRGVWALSAATRMAERLPALNVSIHVQDSLDAETGPVAPEMIQAMLAAEASGQR